VSWTTPKTFVASAVLTAAELNTHLRDNLTEVAPGKIVSLLAKDTTERSTSSTSLADLSSFSGLSIATAVPLLIRVSFRRIGTNNAVMGLALNGTDIFGGATLFVGSGSGAAGSAQIYVPPRETDYLLGMATVHGVSTETTGITNIASAADVAMPAATLTSITLRGKVITSGTLFVKNVYLCRLPTDVAA